MFFKKYHYIILLVFAAGCTSALYQPMPEHASSTAGLDTLVQGRHIYVNKCGSCHGLYLPWQYDEQVWSLNLDEMQERSKITDTEKKMIYQYLIHAPKPPGKSRN